MEYKLCLKSLDWSNLSEEEAAEQEKSDEQKK